MKQNLFWCTFQHPSIMWNILLHVITCKYSSVLQSLIFNSTNWSRVVIHSAQQFCFSERLWYYFVGTSGDESIYIFSQDIPSDPFQFTITIQFILSHRESQEKKMLCWKYVPKITPPYPSSSRMTRAASGPSIFVYWEHKYLCFVLYPNN